MPTVYDIFFVGTSVEVYEKLKSKYPTIQYFEKLIRFDELATYSFTSMFWVIWDDVTLLDTFNLTEYKPTIWDDQYVHVFRNGEHYDGICLFPKNSVVSQKEFDNRVFINKKEIDVVASVPKLYPKYIVSNYEEYLEIADSMFWCIWPEVEITDESIFDLMFSHQNEYDRKENHVFKNMCNDTASYVGGIVLCSNDKKFSKREFERKYVIDKKEHDRVVSRYRYPKYIVSNYEEYLEICKKSSTMFWCIWPEVEITDESIFDLYFDPNTNLYQHDRKENHVFKNSFNSTDSFTNGIVLFSNKKTIGRREFDHRFLIEKKENDKLVSEHKLYDVVFISYNEPNADANFKLLKTLCPRAKRIHGITGIHKAHMTAAELCSTSMMWVVDGDASVDSSFDFATTMSSYDLDCVFVWRSKNPVNDLEYGNGGVKLLPRGLTLQLDTSSLDMTTSISKKFKARTTVSNTTNFNTDPFNTWKSAFRECAKLSSKTINGQRDVETDSRLAVWCTTGSDKLYGNYAIAGAIAGKEFGEINKDNISQLIKINDFKWLMHQFTTKFPDAL
jgi:hypothetical protein